MGDVRLTTAWVEVLLSPTTPADVRLTLLVVEVLQQAVVTPTAGETVQLFVWMPV